ncbi:MAG: helix-turn-helix transcriptional regulator [Hyphomonadaceae bacterium]|nr:helix-turn-helix transcriptional regulator [Hyphomonadaceae bacterium]
MSNLISTEALSDLIGSIYDCAIDPKRWPNTLALIRKELGFHNAVLGLHALPSGKELLNITSGIEPLWVERMPHYGAAVLEDWGGEAVYRNVPMEEPAVRSRVSSYAPAGARESRFRLEWALPQGLIDSIAIIIARDGDSIGSVTLGRHESAGPIGEREIALARLLIPHLQRATTITQLLDCKTVEAATFEAVIDQLLAPVFLVGTGLRIVHANRAARMLLEAGDVVHATEEVLSSRSKGVEAALEAAIGQASRDESELGRKGFGIPARTSTGEARVLHVLPLRFGEFRRGLSPSVIAAVFVAPVSVASTARDVFAELFGLTTAEARVFEHIAAGSTAAETAEALGVGLSTVKTHLLRLFEKTGVNRQADLMALAGSFALPIES